MDGSNHQAQNTHHPAPNHPSLVQLEAFQQQQQLQQQQQQQQQLQQHMALMQMYGCLPTMPGLIATAPVSTTLSETHLQHLMQGGVGGVAGGLAPTTTAAHATLLGVQLPAVYPPHAVPVAIAPLELNTAASAALMQTQNGSWATPVPVVGSCVVNPLQPGMLVTSWVK